MTEKDYNKIQSKSETDLLRKYTNFRAKEKRLKVYFKEKLKGKLSELWVVDYPK